MRTLAVIMARAGSKGLPDKCVLPLCGRPVISYSIDHAQASRLVSEIVLTTDSSQANAIGRSAGISVIDRPAELATDTARVDDVVRHATLTLEERSGRSFDAAVILYGNIPLRGDNAIDDCIQMLQATGCDTVRTVAPVGKMHPDWMHRLDGDRLVQYRVNSIHRRQELEPLYYHDGGVLAVRRNLLVETAGSSDPHAFLGIDRRAVKQRADDCVDVDNLLDFYRAEALLRVKNESLIGESVRRNIRRPPALAVAGSQRNSYE
jgi:CMP-N,N'-diacetyllegionaminic acid synthase